MTIPESKGVSLNGSSTSLTTPIAGSDRVLPLPAANRAVEIGSFLRSSETLLPATQAGYQSYNNGLMSTGMLNCVKSQNGNSMSDNTSLSTGYLSMPNTSPESLPSQMAYCSQPMPLSSQQNESYTPPSSDDYYRLGESDSAYGHSSEGSKRGSESSQNLVNGHPYVRYTVPSPYPTPIMEPQSPRLPSVAVATTS
jgi:hypothetical protein